MDALLGVSPTRPRLPVGEEERTLAGKLILSRHSKGRVRSAVLCGGQSCQKLPSVQAFVTPRIDKFYAEAARSGTDHPGHHMQ